MTNWRVRLKNKVFWLAFIPAILLLAQQILALCGITFDTSEISGKVVEIVETIFYILAVIGVVTDPTTDGICDSIRALGYDAPSKEEAEG